MADITFACANCRQSLEAPEEMAGEAIDCPACGHSITIPSPAAPPTQAAAPACPSCGAGLETDSVLCTACGYHLKLGRKLSTDMG